MKLEWSANKMYRVLIPVLVASFFVGVIDIITRVRVDYVLDRDYFHLWSLADKASTIPAKQQYMIKFVQALEYGQKAGKFSSHDALFLKTPNNQFQANLDALKTLSMRLSQIHDMDPNSFQYNTALHQITQQEQGEASRLLSVFKGCYKLQNTPWIWRWINSIVALVWVAGMIIPLCIMGIFWLENF